MSIVAIYSDSAIHIVHQVDLKSHEFSNLDILHPDYRSYLQLEGPVIASSPDRKWPSLMKSELGGSLGTNGPLSDATPGPAPGVGLSNLRANEVGSTLS